MLQIILVALIYLPYLASFNLQKTIAHDSSCFTQGLVFHDKYLYESCGLNGESTIKKIDHSTGNVVSKLKLDNEVFAEGLTYYDGHLFLLTWKNKKMFIINAEDLTIVSVREYSGLMATEEGWGLTHDGSNLIASDGSSGIYYFDFPSSYASKSVSTPLTKVKQLSVKLPKSAPSTPLRSYGNAVKQINELEYANGFIFANIWYQDVIIKIDPATGYVVNVYDLIQLYPRNTRNPMSDCLNGIAYHIHSDKFMITGKKWAKAFVGSFSNETDFTVIAESSTRQRRRRLHRNL